jgi:hypothetical protein
MATKRDILGTHQKALQVNLDPSKYGTFAEIGAGQEVTRWFFRVGGASGTVAKTISAYDMTVSDAIYGRAERYVSQQRLTTMLDHEYGLLVERLSAKRGATTKFFAFADTAAATSFSRREDGHGWLGVRFQDHPGAEPSQVVLHMRLTDKENLQQQEALGILGVNLIHSALYFHNDIDLFIAALLDNLTLERVEVDMIKCTGPAFHGVDNRLLSLKLVQEGLTNAAMFLASGENVQPADALYKKAILLERGSFRPVTNATYDMLRASKAMFVQEPRLQDEEFIVLMEMTQKNLLTEGGIDHKDFLERVDMLCGLGQNVIITNFAEFHRLAAYLFRYTKKMIGIVMGVPTLKEIFDEKYYANLEGGILESFGRLFKNDLKIYAYPLLDDKTGSLITAGNLRVAPNLRHLYSYLTENRFIDGIRDYDEKNLTIFAREVLAHIRAGTNEWEHEVPAAVANMIKERKLLGYSGAAKPAAATPARAETAKIAA